MDYLDGLPFSPIERSKLRQLAAPTPAALLGMIRASTEAFSRFFGPGQTERLVACLTAVVGPEESERLARPPEPFPVQSSVFSNRPAPPLPPKYDLEERDRLFGRLRQLRADPHPSDRTRAEAAACEAKLNAMLEQ